MKPKISIIIPTYKRTEMLIDLLQSIKNYIQDFTKLEVIVVDDGSPNGQEKERKVREALPYLPFQYHTQVNSGPAKARNNGVSKSQGEYLVFLDDDTEITAGWIDQITEGYVTENIAGIAGYTISYQSNTLVEKYLSHVEHLHRHQFNKDGTLGYVCTANCSFRRDVFLKAGGFSEELKLPAGDDMDLGFKISLLGYEFAFNPKAVAYHKHRSNLYQMWKLFFISGRGAYRCAVIHKNLKRENVTRVKKFEFLLIVKTIQNIAGKLFREFRSSKIPKHLAALFAWYETTNHVFYQLGRYYEMALMKMQKQRA